MDGYAGDWSIFVYVMAVEAVPVVRHKGQLGLRLTLNNRANFDDQIVVACVDQPALEGRHLSESEGLLFDEWNGMKPMALVVISKDVKNPVQLTILGENNSDFFPILGNLFEMFL